MNRKIVLLAFVSTLLSLTVVSGLPTSIVAHPAEIVVPDNYEKIQWAIGNASNSDTIFVKAGTYYEHVIVTKSVKLLGEDRNTTIIDGGVSISQWTSNVVISGFTIQNGDNGISLPSWSSNSVISNNIITKNGYGIIGGYDCFKVTVSDNIITSNNFSGIWLGFPHGIVSNNIISENGKGWGGAYRELTSGIDIVEGGNNNTITGNTIENNYNGIVARYTEGNIIYHNNFINNTNQAIGTYSSTFTWDDGYPSGGNHWNDYTGEDRNGDGIGDTPYVIDENNQDNYPLMNQWIPPTQHSDSFPITWIVAAIVVAVVGAALLVYFAKVRKTTGKVEE